MLRLGHCRKVLGLAEGKAAGRQGWLPGGGGLLEGTGKQHRMEHAVTAAPAWPTCPLPTLMCQKLYMCPWLDLQAGTGCRTPGSQQLGG